MSAQLQHQQLEFQQLQEKYVLLAEDKRKQDVSMKRWVRRASKAEEMVLKLEETNKSLQEQCQNQDTIIANLDEQVTICFLLSKPYHQKKKMQKKKQNVGLLKLCAIMYKHMMPKIML